MGLQNPDNLSVFQFPHPEYADVSNSMEANNARNSFLTGYVVRNQQTSKKQKLYLRSFSEYSE